MAAGLALAIGVALPQTYPPLEEQVASLVRDLGGEDPVARWRAREELDALGVHALRALAELREFPNAEVEAEVRERVEALARDPVSPVFGRPVRVSFDFAGGTLAEGLHRLLDDLGFTFQLQGFLSVEARLPPMQFEQVPIYEALDRIAWESGLRYDGDLEGTRFARDGEPLRPAIAFQRGGHRVPVVYPGPLRIALEEVRRHRVVQGGQSSTELVATMTVYYPPCVRALEVWHRLDSATTEDGTSVAEGPHEWVQLRVGIMHQGEYQARGLGGPWVDVPLDPSATGDSISLAGRFRFDVPGIWDTVWLSVCETTGATLAGIPIEVTAPDPARGPGALFILRGSTNLATFFYDSRFAPIVRLYDAEHQRIEGFVGTWSGAAGIDTYGAMYEIDVGEGDAPAVSEALLLVPADRFGVEVPYAFENAPLPPR